MLTDSSGSPNGHTIFDYKAGHIYVLPDDLAGLFLNAGLAEQDKSLDGPSERKAIKKGRMWAA